MYSNDEFHYHAKNGDYNQVTNLLHNTLANPFNEKVMKDVIKRKFDVMSYRKRLFVSGKYICVTYKDKYSDKYPDKCILKRYRHNNCDNCGRERSSKDLDKVINIIEKYRDIYENSLIYAFMYRTNFEDILINKKYDKEEFLKSKCLHYYHIEEIIKDKFQPYLLRCLSEGISFNFNLMEVLYNKIIVEQKLYDYLDYFLEINNLRSGAFCKAVEHRDMFVAERIANIDMATVGKFYRAHFKYLCMSTNHLSGLKFLFENELLSSSENINRIIIETCILMLKSISQLSEENLRNINLRVLTFIAHYRDLKSILYEILNITEYSYSFFSEKIICNLYEGIISKSLINKHQRIRLIPHIYNHYCQFMKLAYEELPLEIILKILWKAICSYQ